MNNIELHDITLIGLSLKTKTTNKNGQSGIDCGNLWQEFENGKYTDFISGKLSEEIFAVYHQYDGDHTQPYSYFIGCKVLTGTKIPAGMERLMIPEGTYHKIITTGKMPDCVANAWQEIWLADFPRKYEVDFEVYNEKSKDWHNAEVEIYLSIIK